jgi:3-oxoacyl-[acyl-carrier protein] reductase
MNVRNKTVIITGAARGIGQEYARVLGVEGAKVVVGDINDCAETVRLVSAAGGECIGAKLDVTDERSAQALVALAVEKYGALNAIVNNAALYGALKGGRFETIPEEDWDAAMSVNVKGIWNCCKAATPALRHAGGGSIINIASLAATYGMPFALHYTTSKAAVIGLTRGLARELGRDNIRVNAIAPSAVLTAGTQEFFGAKADKALDTVKAGQSIQRNLEPSDVAGAALWLVSDASSFTTGQTIAVDGGTVFH